MKRGIPGSSVYTVSAVAIAITATIAALLCTVVDFTEAQVIPAFGEFPVALTLKSGPFDVSGCDPGYSADSPNVLFSALPLNRDSQVALMHLNDYEGGREALCNQCLMVSDLESTKSIIVRLVGDCRNCMEDELRLSPAAYQHLGDGYGSIDGFFTFTACPDPNSKEANDKFGPLKGRPPGPIPTPGVQ
ncbi:hypothetical protein BG015_004492 [Linnemannia schmuckeri]|uniref:RlpA-like protein double-psi beta-barrel domain-containing protein n=1 Tax=Linnemannia schmuckeri TaxID=64567 RepID=A0A9P5S1R6_9FUNG|nr:hypothetical protein BG015_004492 [Linnemannia schmuckeri]